ncbi:MAG TPA: RNA 2'-phosphotransferase [Rhodothermales bacterium]|nr:RNA 2'-phosphotransferase [Rhodothermales bacterium]
MDPALVRVSKFLSLVLRHRPEAAGVRPDAEGWVDVEALIEGAGRKGVTLDRALLGRVVAENDKGRFEWDEAGERIRARQGHSIQVELGLEEVVPPERLFHGTVDRFLTPIRREGLIKGKRHHVHLSADRETAVKVGARRGAPVVLIVEAGRMHGDGFAFFRTGNGVWLVEHVPPAYLVTDPDDRP